MNTANLTDDEFLNMDLSPDKEEPGNLTDWANEPTVTVLKEDLSSAKLEHDEHTKEVDTWLDELNGTGTAKIPAVKGQSSLVPKVIRKQAEWVYTSLSDPFLSNDDIFEVEPVTFEDNKAAEQNSLVLNNQFNTKIDKVAFVDEFVRTAVDEGTVIVKVSWEFEERTEIVEVPEFSYFIDNQNPQVKNDLVNLHHQLQADPSAANQLAPEQLKAYELSQTNGAPVSFKQVGTIQDNQTRTIKNQPVLEVCSYKNVIIDPTCQGNLDNANFIIYTFETSKAELEKAGIYKNLDHIKAESSSPLHSADYESKDNDNFNFKDKARKRLLAYEYWGFYDIEKDGVLVPIVATFVGSTMIRMEENPYPDGKLPFVKAHYLPVRKSNYGEPIGALLSDNQKITGAVTRGMIDIMGKSANGQMAFKKGALDVTNKRKFEAGKDFEVNESADVSRAFYMNKYPEIPQSAQLMLGLQNSEAEGLTGVKAYSGGISGTALGDTATGIRGALDAASKRELGILRRLANCIVQIGRKVIAMNSEFLDEEEVVRITNSEFITVKRDDLAGDIDLRLSISTPEQDEQKASELSFMLQTMGNNMDTAMSNLILAKIAKLRKMPELAKMIENYAPEPDPMQVKKAELELELLQQQIETEKAKTQQLLSGSVLDESKSLTEGAKAENIQSDTDLKDLEHVETESGTKQARELEKASQQAEANAQLEVVKKRLNPN